jgi:CDP-glycerol glycerophosphotransferase (TagB/SpsB family)
MTDSPAMLRMSFAAAARDASARWPVVRASFRMLYGILRILVLANSKQIGFVSAPDIADNALALFEKLAKSSRAHGYRLVWLVGDTLTSEHILHREFAEADLANVSIVRKNSPRGLWTFLRCRYLFSTHGAYGFAQSGYHQTIVNLWHGMPIKAIGVQDGKSRRDFPFMHYTIATSEYFADLIAEAFCLQRDRALVTGLPRNEWLFQKEERYFAIKESRGKLVVWLPTFRTSYVGEMRADSSADAPDPLSAGTLAKLDEMLEGVGALLVIKLHLMDSKNRQAWPSYRNIRIYTDSRFRAEGLNLYKLLACSDALVTDFSSCAIDYMLLNRPIGLFAPDISSYIRGFFPDVLKKVEAACYPLTSAEEFGAFMTSLPAEREPTPEQEVLCQMDLRSPSKAILRAIGLGNLLS